MSAGGSNMAEVCTEALCEHIKDMLRIMVTRIQSGEVSSDGM